MGDETEVKAEPETNPVLDQAQVAEAEARGRASVIADLNATAKELGFDDLKALLTRAVRREPARTEMKPEPKAETKPEPKAEAAVTRPSAAAVARLEKQVADLLEEKKQLNRARSASERAKVRTEKTMTAQQAETELRLIATRAGVADVDFALHLIRGEVKHKTPAELKTFQPDQFFTGLRETKPYLFAEVQVPVSTVKPMATPGSGSTSTAPPPKAAPTSAVQSGKTDALKMSDAEYQTYLRDNGLTPPAGSFH